MITQLYTKNIEGEYLPVHIKNIKLPTEDIQLLAQSATITEEEVEKWCEGTISNHMLNRLTEIITGQYSLKEAREDVLSFRNEVKK